MKANIASFFSRVYIINLVERKDRFNEMNRQLKKIGIEFPNEKIEFFPAIKPKLVGGFESLGAKGCFLSHLNVLGDAIDRKLERILILEDDVNFSRDFTGRIGEVLAELGRLQWAFFYGGYRVNDVKGGHDSPCLVTVPPVHAVGTTHFLAVQGDAIALTRAYLNAMLYRELGDPNGGPMHVDGAYSWFRRAHPHFKTLIAIPELGYQRPSRSDVYKLAWFDRVPITAAMVRYCRIFKSRIKQLLG